MPIFLEDVQREYSELIDWLTDYNHAVAQGVARDQLLEIFDATLECVRKYFHAMEILFEETAWPRFQLHHFTHCQITKELEAYRRRIAGKAQLDTIESSHVLDAVLIQFIQEQPLFYRLYIQLAQAHRDESLATACAETTPLPRQSWTT